MAATAKKPSRKATTKTAGARASKKSTAKKVDSPTKAATAAKTGNLGPLERIRSFLLTSSIVYLLLAAAVAALVSALSTKLTLSVQARDFFSSAQNTLLGPSSEVIATIPAKYFLIASLLLSALGSILIATKLQAKYGLSVANKTSGFRWLYMGFTAGILLNFIAVLAGITDVAVLKMICGLIITTTLLSWLSERENLTAGPRWLAYVASLYTGFLAWLPILVSLIGTTIYGQESFPWYVYASAGVTLAGFISFALNQSRHIKGRFIDYLQAEENYWRIDFVTKFVVTAIIIAALFDR